MGLHAEIFEQPAVLRRFLNNQVKSARQIAAAIQKRNIDYIFLTARGTSDNAGLYAKYLWGIFNHLPIALAAPSTFGVYQQPPRLNRAAVVGISQSGQSPDIVGVLEEGKRQGALTIAITNAPDSPLANTADYVLYIDAGEEKAVAATKTYTAQLMAIAALSAALSESDEMLETLHHVPTLVEETLVLDSQIEQVAERYRYMNQCVVLGRGYNYATAFEWSLKLKELTYIVANPYSPADFQHGPIAILEKGFPVFAVAPQGAVYKDILALLRRLSDIHQAEILVLSNADEALRLANTPLRLPAPMPEWVSPIVSIVPAQLFCYYLTRAKGWNTESPRGLKKVTETR
ncbi:MAG: glucosamine--fructose-6-phosphate aminotransferase [Chloroflexota bacterium]|nr:MAG: glucosamine--fructose-6-phosphate aminotransferase [Chloroflexota bacterium]